MTIFCPKHPRYLAHRRPRVRRLCWCWPLFMAARLLAHRPIAAVLAWLGWALRVGRPVVHRRKDAA